MRLGGLERHLREMTPALRLAHSRFTPPSPAHLAPSPGPRVPPGPAYLPSFPLLARHPAQWRVRRRRARVRGRGARVREAGGGGRVGFAGWRGWSSRTPWWASSWPPTPSPRGPRPARSASPTLAAAAPRRRGGSPPRCRTSPVFGFHPRRVGGQPPRVQRPRRRQGPPTARPPARPPAHAPRRICHRARQPGPPPPRFFFLGFNHHGSVHSAARCSCRARQSASMQRAASSGHRGAACILAVARSLSLGFHFCLFKVLVLAAFLIHKII